ncbi:hypothetical protein UP09_07240 [Bradyrhizobium sp. LTSP885]|uniref:hypothetical protein n=1 Tax=Bradyrhizobium sp. LTSP885 TaxID=1619232 RepID=UPI0005CB146F|nr:hypothetical protein [Bradyrhizobium sp. LTSP885]KJC49485.1 hypothetical protein UP09_07240 [Bradyrhizobium sp. LTSP885]
MKNGPLEFEKHQQPAKQYGWMRHGIAFSIACVVLYSLVMLGVRFYAHHVGPVGGLLTIAGMLIAAHWYDHRQERKRSENCKECLPAACTECGADRPPSTIHIKRPEIDLPLDDWQSDGEKRREPIFGPDIDPR